MIHLDAAATSPVRREVLEAMWPHLTGEFGNPSSTHGLGASAARALAEARRTVAEWLGCRPGEVVFTSGGTEADNLAVKGLALAAIAPDAGRSGQRGRHLVRSAIEHPAVVESVAFLERVHGFEVTVVGVDGEGLVDPDEFAAALRPDTALATVMHANNEVGSIQPMAELAARAAAHGVPFHTDAVQSAGWLDTRLGVLGVDALSISGHKLGAPKGIGALAVRRRIEPLVHGGGQERGVRSGTENVAFAVGLAAAVRLLGRPEQAAARAARTSALRDGFIREVLHRVPGAVLTGPSITAAGGAGAGGAGGAGAGGAGGAGAGAAGARGASAGAGARAVDVRLPSVASFCFPGTSGESILLQLEERGVIVSSGSACAAGSDDPSPVLLALGLAPEVAQTAVRFTFTADTTAADLSAASAALVAALADLRALAP
ncbi:cysteine desulfurase [Herbiconiux sp. CPCC 203407]|uniref:cysteine desulfurase n=1 Tax=Herbiconiux oxytropis TaxID=2970915 RepID=A0AA41XGK4_9MICO|nr:cysteine desulfurase family protein [Herbiconiux oxytropis]MCS5724120.1 cysteine desulfurase [Herbiconiux oxytropis]MCS5725283.1 cysteine desulfurase [Herbiconiux oxytropis]